MAELINGFSYDIGSTVTAIAAEKCNTQSSGEGEDGSTTIIGASYEITLFAIGNIKPVHIVGPGKEGPNVEGWISKGIFPTNAGNKPVSDVATHTYNYTGSPIKSGYEPKEDEYILSGDTEKTDICIDKNYFAIASLEKGHLWSDKTSDSVKLEWKIQGGALYYRDGIEWKKCLIYTYDGNNWKIALPYLYDGNEWRLTKF